jgi:hypothetical protein
VGFEGAEEFDISRLSSGELKEFKMIIRQTELNETAGLAKHEGSDPIAVF